MKAVVMAGGEGTRLRPMTANQPKPLLPVVNRPIMEHVLRLLKRHGFDETVVTVQFLASLVRTYFGDGEELGMHLSYATEEAPLGTAGSVRNAHAALRDDAFLVISGDSLTDIDLGALVRAHRAAGALAVLADALDRLVTHVVRQEAEEVLEVLDARRLRHDARGGAQFGPGQRLPGTRRALAVRLLLLRLAASPAARGRTG